MDDMYNYTDIYFRLYDDNKTKFDDIKKLTNVFTPSTTVESTSTTGSPLSETATSTQPAVSTTSFLSTTTLTLSSAIIHNYTNNNQNYNDNTDISIYYQLKNESDFINLNNDSYSNSSFLLRNTSFNNSNFNINDSAKLSYESGSNFMLLLEDFGEYFYNYNGSDFNSSVNIYQPNCSLTNSTCEISSSGEYHFNITFLKTFRYF
jgi:hypothetical protein